jgi:hypothetical protein
VIDGTRKRSRSNGRNRMQLPKIKKTPWPESASELYQPIGLRFSSKLMPIFADKRWHLVSVTYPYGGCNAPKLKFISD